MSRAVYVSRCSACDAVEHEASANRWACPKCGQETMALIRVDADSLVERRPPVYGESHYDGLRATDGTPIDSKRKHRDYMKATGLALADDFKETWRKEKSERERRRQGHDPRRRESVARALYNNERNRK